jgi:hypothetical protein
VPGVPPPDVLNHSWREYGNRVGAWRCLDLFDALGIPIGALINTSLYDHCPELMQAFAARGDELIGRGRTNAKVRGNGPRTASARTVNTAATAQHRSMARRRRAGFRPESPKAMSRPTCCRRRAFATRSTGAMTTSR